MRDFSLLDMVDFFKCSDCGLSVISFCSGENRGRSVEDSGIGNGICIGSARGRVVEVVIHGYDEEVEVREERRVLVKVCKVR